MVIDDREYYKHHKHEWKYCQRCGRALKKVVIHRATYDRMTGKKQGWTITNMTCPIIILERSEMSFGMGDPLGGAQAQHDEYELERVRDGD